MELMELNDTNEDNNTLENASTSSRRRFRFGNEDDIRILREIASVVPFGDKAGIKWKSIHETLQLTVKDYIAIKNRFLLLMQKFKKGNTKSLRGSGVEEDYNEKMQLLEDIKGFMETAELEENDKSNKKIDKEDEDQKAAKSIRDAAMNTVVKVNKQEDCEPSKRTKKEDVLQLIRLSDERDHSMKETSLVMEERKLAVQEKQLALQEKE